MLQNEPLIAKVGLASPRMGLEEVKNANPFKVPDRERIYLNFQGILGAFMGNRNLLLVVCAVCSNNGQADSLESGGVVWGTTMPFDMEEGPVVKLIRVASERHEILLDTERVDYRKTSLPVNLLHICQPRKRISKY